VVITVARFTHGLGATTNLHDAAPWGFWIGFDVMAGVALAAGAFVLAATVYIFHLEKYRGFVRPAILTAFLGYAAVAVGLLYDLGLPWNIWHPMIYWQHHSVLFEVAMCVMFYLTVLALEFAPVVLEHPLFDRPLFRAILSFLKRITLLLVIAGIILSTLHQSSLGSLFLIAPHRLHPLWYSPIIYVLFFVSAIGLGLMVVTAESLLAGYFLKHKVKKQLMGGLGVAAAIVLSVYLVLRVGDLAVRGQLGYVLDGSGLSLLFLLELAMSTVVPIILLAIPRVRHSIGGLGTVAGLVVFGMVGYRINVCFVAFARPADAPYFPAWTEVAVSFGIVAAAILVFIFFVENLKVYDDEPPGDDAKALKPSYDPATLHGLMPATFAAPRRYSLAVIVAAAITVALLPEQAVMGLRPRSTPVQAARAVDGWVLDREPGTVRTLLLPDAAGAAPAHATVASLLMIDGNRDGRLVLFNHKDHELRLGEANSCGQCHHLNMPLDDGTSCHECHRDMYEPTPTFDHAKHVVHTDGNTGCVKCHEDPTLAKTYETSTACMECHADMLAPNARVDPPADRWNDAVGYMDAMHELCVKCHEQYVLEQPDEYPAALQDCRACHDVDQGERLRRLIPDRDRPLLTEAMAE
jgi:Ni/Fe-hydrogenase subunit HybB-like protein